jgi:transketolase
VHHELGNLCVIVDKNNLQAMGTLDEVLAPRRRPNVIEEKLAVFGMEAASVAGHDLSALVQQFEAWSDRRPGSSPQALIAETVKGWGLLAIENKTHFHFRLPTAEEIAQGVRYG